MIVVPEIIIKQELESLIRRYYDDYVGLEQTATVVDASDVDSGVTINVVQQGAVGVPEKTEVTMPVPTNMSGTHWLLNTPSTNFFVWYTVDGVGTIPDIVDRIAIRVDLLGTDTSNDVATKTRVAIAAQTQYFLAGAVTNVVTVTNKETSAVNRSLLYQIFGNLKFDGTDYTKSMASMIKARYESESRKFTINLGYNKNREAFPQISILLPSEENDPKYTGVVQGKKNFYDGTFADTRQHNFQTTYTLFITSDNYNEVVLLYHFLKTIILVGMDNFTCRGLENIWVSGRDITMDFDIDPALLYHRTVAMSFFYENEVPELKNIQTATEINFTGTIKP